MKHFFIPILLVFVVGCAHSSKKSAQAAKEKKQKTVVQKIAPQTVAKNTRKPQNKKLSEQDLLAELTGKKASSVTEASLYLSIAEAFQGAKYELVRSKAQEFYLRFPNSTLTDNVLYVSALSEMENSQYLAALKNFQKIEADYPRGDRAAAARLSKALMYKRMNLQDQSRINFATVRSFYPGSPEAFRAEAELKMLK